MNAKALSCFFAALLFACSGGGDGSAANAPAPPASAASDISLLFMGNSHTLNHDVPATVAALVRAGRPGKTVTAVTAPGSMFLEERINHQATLELLKGRQWSAVVLQAQKTSSSWTINYPIEPSIELVKLSRAQAAIPVLYPEWARRGMAESHLIYDVHTSIAKAQPACIAPIGQAWDLALSRHASLTLHDTDGNHANAAGAFLTAAVLYATLTGESPRDLASISVTSVDATTQALLRGIAADAIQSVSPRLWCPRDKTL
jgi:hypothetical protein